MRRNQNYNETTLTPPTSSVDSKSSFKNPESTTTSAQTIITSSSLSSITTSSIPSNSISPDTNSITSTSSNTTFPGDKPNEKTKSPKTTSPTKSPTTSTHTKPPNDNPHSNSTSPSNCSGTTYKFPGFTPSLTITVTQTISVTITGTSISLPQPSTTETRPFCKTETIAESLFPVTSTTSMAGLESPSAATVTKKTWVPVYVPSSQNPPDFGGNPTHPGGSLNQDTQLPGPGQTPTGSNPPISTPPSSGTGSSGGSGGNPGSPGSAGGNPPGGGGQASPGSGASASQGIGDIIASAFGIPSSGGGSTGGTSAGSSGGSGGGRGSPPAPVAADVNGVWLVAAPTAIIVGSQYVPVPKAGSQPIVVTESGELFTIGPSQVLGPDTTIAIPGGGISPMTLGAVSFSVGASSAVIGGKTYAIGPGAHGTTIVVNGQTISVGTGGVGFATTTVPPEAQITSPPLSAVTAGGLVLYVDASEAIYSGTIYHIGAGATQTTAVINGMTLTFGEGGISYAGSTVHPAGMTTADATSTTGKSPSTTTGGVFASATQTANHKGSAAPMKTLLRPVLAMISTVFAIIFSI
ncbi:MAG: hypothetical protein Q9227_002234 [Pyrenula ochraceoflavens]